MSVKERRETCQHSIKHVCDKEKTERTREGEKYMDLDEYIFRFDLEKRVSER